MNIRNFEHVVKEQRSKLLTAWLAFLKAQKDKKIPTPNVYTKYYEIEKDLDDKEKEENLLEIMSHLSEVANQIIGSVPEPIIKELKLEEIFSKLSYYSKKIEKLEKELNFLKESYLKDELTGLWNKNGLKKYFEDVVKPNIFEEDFVVLFLDLDKFKKVNDTFGHDTGDRLLCCFSEFLKKQFRDTDFVCRIHGDEFVVILNMTTIDKVQEKVKDLFEKPYTCSYHGKKIVVKPSIGITNIIAADSLKEVLCRADQSMYYHKKNRKLRPIRV